MRKPGSGELLFGSALAVIAWQEMPTVVTLSIQKGFIRQLPDDFSTRLPQVGRDDGNVGRESILYFLQPRSADRSLRVQQGKPIVDGNQPRRFD